MIPPRRHLNRLCQRDRLPRRATARAVAWEARLKFRDRNRVYWRACWIEVKWRGNGIRSATGRSTRILAKLLGFGLVGAIVIYIYALLSLLT
jgi:hypothetical protein